MRITLQRSGAVAPTSSAATGRGEYEIAGVFGDLSASDLLGRRIEFESPLGGTLTTAAILTHERGKWTLRLDGGATNAVHATPFIAATLLLPKPRRSNPATEHPASRMLDGEYLLDDLHFDVLELSDEEVSIRVVGIDGHFRDGTAFHWSREDIADRCALIAALENDEAFAREFDPEWSEYIGALTTNANSGRVFEGQRDLQANVRAMWRKANDQDPLNSASSETASGLDHETPDVEGPLAPPTVEDLPEVRRRKIDQYRRVAARTYRARKFAREVKEAYGFSCAVCGKKLPKTKYTTHPGVDAAHILPWSDYDVDVLPNGLALCKHHHWAFDQFLYYIEYDAEGGYRIRVTDVLHEIQRQDPEFAADVAELDGRDLAKIPDDPSKRPAPDFLTRYADALKSED